MAQTRFPVRPIEPQRQPDLGLVVHDISARRHDPQHFARPAPDLDHVPDDRLSCKRGLPQLVRQNDDRGKPLSRRRIATPVGFSRCEEAAVRRLIAERLECLFVHVRRTHAQRSIAASDIRFPRLEPADRHE
jgi:hypothetical protein